MEETTMAQATLNIPNISCGHCVSAIESELADMHGVTTAKADAATKTVTVEWDDPASIDEIRAKLTEINYPAQ
jgi:copper chaperone CopZ